MLKIFYILKKGSARNELFHALKSFFGLLIHRTKYQESVNGNVVEICETVAETRRSTRVSASGLVTFTRVSVAAVPTEPDHFFTRFRQVSVEGNV